MGCNAGRYNKTSTPQGIFIVIPSLEGWPTKAKEGPSPHEIRLTPLDTNLVFQCLGGINVRLSASERKSSFEQMEMPLKLILLDYQIFLSMVTSSF